MNKINVMCSIVLFVISFLMTSQSPSADYYQLRVWRTEDGGNGHSYMIVPGVPSGGWQEAINDIHQYDAHLSTITSPEEANFIMNYVIDNPFAKSLAWTGVYGPMIGGYWDGNHFAWTTEEPWIWTPWSTKANEADAGANPPHPPFCNQEPASVDCPWGLMFQNQDCIFRPALQWEFVGVAENCMSKCFEGYPASYIMEWDNDCDHNGLVDVTEIHDGLVSDNNNNMLSDLCECLCDVSQDRTVGVLDLALFLQAWPQGQGDLIVDFNEDETVNSVDLVILLSLWGMDCEDFCVVCSAD